jgi:hypothetical protein
VLLLLVVIGILVSQKGGGEAKQADTKLQTTQQAKIDDRPLPTPTVTKKTEPIAKKPPDDPPPDKPKVVPEWVDASTEGSKLGPVRVRVTAIEVDHIFGKNPDDISKDKQLIVRLNIENASIGQRVTYKGWGATPSQEGNPGAQLRDEQGKAYKRILFEKPELIEGLVVEREFAPSVQFTDMLIFEVPKTEWKMLYLELPAVNYGQVGQLKFQIPETMLAFAQPPMPDEPPPKLTPPEEQKILALRKTLRDKRSTPVSRQRTAEALRAFGAKAFSAANDLGKALEDESEGVRLAAAQALAGMGALARPALPELTSALQDEFWKVQAEAARALGNIGPPAKDAIPRLQRLLKSKDEEVPAAAQEAIKKIQGRVAKK